MADYSKEKVPDLKKLLQERGLAISGNKADLIARLQEDDSKKVGGGAGMFHFPSPSCPGRLPPYLQSSTSSTGDLSANIFFIAGAGEDEIDWDEDDKPTTESAAAAIAAGGQGAVSNPTAVPNQVVDNEPSTTSDLKATQPAATSTEPAPLTTTEGEATAQAVPEEPKPDFSIGLKESDALTEAEKRAARAKRFGIPENEEAKKLVERAKKFGLADKESGVKGLDSALPERKAKRGREGKEGGEGRAAKRQTPDRRTGPKPRGKPEGKKEGGGEGKKEVVSGGGGAGGKIADDPVERAKMEARAKKFGKPLAA
jgi:SAP domain-containing ribonucleoprotein